MNAPEASIIIPVYNRIEDVRHLLDRLAQQSRTDFEVVLVDDCSHEPVAQTVNPEQYPWPLRILRHDVNGGVGKARNTGVSNAQGATLIFVDSDADVPDADWYERFMALYRRAGEMAEHAEKKTVCVPQRGARYSHHASGTGGHLFQLVRIVHDPALPDTGPAPAHEQHRRSTGRVR